MTCSLCHGPHDWDMACPPAPREGDTGGFAARFASDCRECREAIEPGDMIVMTSLGAIHRDCE